MLPLLAKGQAPVLQTRFRIRQFPRRINRCHQAAVTHISHWISHEFGVVPTR